MRAHSYGPFRPFESRRVSLGELSAGDRYTTFVVLNRASPNPKDNDASEAREAIVACHTLRLAEVVICDRVAVKRAAPAGLTVSEYKPFDPKAAHEITQLYDLVFAQHG